MGQGRQWALGVALGILMGLSPEAVSEPAGQYSTGSPCGIGSLHSSKKTLLSSAKVGATKAAVAARAGRASFIEAVLFGLISGSEEVSSAV